MEQNNQLYNYQVCFEYGESKFCCDIFYSSAAPGVDDIGIAEIAVKEYMQTHKIKIEGIYPRNIEIIYNGQIINHWSNFHNY